MKISVVTASYNSEATIGFTIESFLEQKHSEKEMLVIDGASSDATVKIVIYSHPSVDLTEHVIKEFDRQNK